MKKQNKSCQHDWQVTRELSELEKRVTSAQVEVKCCNCGKKGYVRWSDLSWMMKR